MKIKICGITCLEDALDAVDAGTDLLGFNFYPKSPRYIKPPAAAKIIADVCSRDVAVLMVGVFVNESPAVMRTTACDCALDLVQLSGDEPPETLRALRDLGYKALRPKDPHDLAESMRRFPARIDAPAYLIDANRPGLYGGTGQTADWSLAQALAATTDVLLAGGLTPENVAEAIGQVQPWGVDVASGVEASPGRKDRRKMEAFVKAARAAQN